jgi:hypothetical protein
MGVPTGDAAKRSPGNPDVRRRAGEVASARTLVYDDYDNDNAPDHNDPEPYDPNVYDDDFDGRLSARRLGRGYARLVLELASAGGGLR